MLRIVENAVLAAARRARDYLTRGERLDALRAANEGDRDFAEVKHQLRHDGGYESLRSSLGREKALELVLREARVKPGTRTE